MIRPGDLCDRTCTTDCGHCKGAGKSAEPCDACGAEQGEPCRFGCLGYAIEHDNLTENGE